MLDFKTKHSVQNRWFKIDKRIQILFSHITKDKTDWRNHKQKHTRGVLLLGVVWFLFVGFSF